MPVSICNLSKWMPPRHLVPIGVPDDIVVVIHPPVETKGRPEFEVSKEVSQNGYMVLNYLNNAGTD